MRMFIGFGLSLENKKKIEKLQKDSDVKGRFTAIDNLHLTLIFLGELNNNEIEKVKNVLKDINYPSFTYKTTNLEMLRDIAILKVDLNNDLQNIYDKIYDMLSKEGFSLNKRKYFPHITLIRNCDEKLHMDFSITQKVESIVLYSSEHIDGKLTYIPRFIKKFKDSFELNR